MRSGVQFPPGAPMNKISNSFGKLLFIIIIFCIGLGVGKQYFNKPQPTNQAEKNTPKAFISEVYDKIKENYWDNISDVQLLDLFQLALQKNGASSQVAKIDSKDKLLNLLTESLKSIDEGKRNQFVANVAGSVLASLSPVGRSGLYTQKQEEQLKNTVSNINPGKDLYQDLGVKKDASAEAIAQAYQKQSEALAKDQSPQAQEKLKQISYAKDVLTKTETKSTYDQNKAEPTIFAKIITPGILYIQFKKFSPTSYDEFVRTFESFKTDASLNSLIFDLRDNIGGAIDATVYFLGNFIGINQNAFDFYHKGEYLPFKTPRDKLPSITKYKQVVILVNNQTQSSAEMMAASLKKYRVGVVLGASTKGWGTVEKVFPLDNQFDSSQKFSLFLVHSITLRDDNQPIEGRGVDPDINIKDAAWEQQLFSYFRNQQLNEAVKQII